MVFHLFVYNKQNGSPDYRRPYNTHGTFTRRQTPQVGFYQDKEIAIQSTSRYKALNVKKKQAASVV
jgi:hypothetical protein